MNRARLFVRCWVVLCGAIPVATAANATFHRAINLNGPALVIDGHHWEAGATTNFSTTGKSFENQSVPLRPATDTARARMIRSSRWGDKVDLTLSNAPAGPLQVFLYVWEDNHNEKLSFLVNGRVVVEEFHSGSAGMWKRLGPWKCEAVSGNVTISARAASHGAANLSGLEVWSGDGVIPDVPGTAFADAPTADQIAFFESKVRPVLVERCYECHSAKSEKLRGGLLLDSRAGIRKGGDTGPAIAPGDPDASLLIEAVRHKSEDLAMPPKKKLPPEQIAALEEWVRMGAPDPRGDDTLAVVQAKGAIDWAKARQWWAFQPLGSPEPPRVKNKSWPENDLDRFILARIETAGLRPAPDAGPRVLIRRMTYDLTGLPPTPQEVEDFLAAYARNARSAIGQLADRLLASPAYGERWGRLWLDVVRYADTAGDNSDFPIPQMHRYRDWVIGAFNRDLPYDRFVREQLAGDLLPDRTDDQVIATGYIANSRRFGSRVDDYPQHLTIEDTIDNFGRAFLGLSINCARCHDHKFDPITTQDYYALYGIFHSTRYPWPGIELDQKQRDLVPLVPRDRISEALKAQKARDEEQRRLEKEVKRLEDDLKNKEGDEKKALQAQIEKAREAAKAHAARPALHQLAYAVADAARTEDATVHLKGDPARPGQKVKRRFLTVLGGAELPPDDTSSGRAQLADWVLAPDNPLPARVMANRIWLHHFGKGLVSTPNDFGRQGRPPTHPELLDWLAARFVAGGWSVKQLHRTILLSHTYRQSGGRSEAAIAKDPNNDLLAGFPRRRLDAESIRDTLLTLGGTLDCAPGGAHPFPPQNEWKFTQHNPFRATYDTHKRSVYLMTQRIQRHPYLAVFDGADPSASTPRRLTSTTPLQALYLLNDPLVHEQAAQFAKRLLAAHNDDQRRIELAYEMAFCRPPTATETKDAVSFLDTARAQLRETGGAADCLDTEAWQAMTRVLLRLNEFVYLD